MNRFSGALNTKEDLAERGFALRHPPLALLGYDPAGDGTDNDALCLLAREEHQRGEPHDPDFSVITIFRLMMAMRMRPDLEFPDKLAMILGLHRSLIGWERAGRTCGHTITVEQNGVGYAMASSLREKVGNRVIGYTTVGNTKDEAFMERKVSMPRLASLDHLRVLMETQHFKAAKDMVGKAEFLQEAQAFVWRSTGRPEAMQGQKDDIIMTVAGACWIGSKVIGPMLKQVKTTTRGVG